MNYVEITANCCSFSQIALLFSANKRKLSAFQKLTSFKPKCLAKCCSIRLAFFVIPTFRQLLSRLKRIPIHADLEIATFITKTQTLSRYCCRKRQTLKFSSLQTVFISLAFFNVNLDNSD